MVEIAALSALSFDFPSKNVRIELKVFFGLAFPTGCLLCNGDVFFTSLPLGTFLDRVLLDWPKSLISINLKIPFPAANSFLVLNVFLFFASKILLFSK